MINDTIDNTPDYETDGLRGSSEIKTDYSGVAYDFLSPRDQLLYRQYMDRLAGANWAGKERRHRAERIDFVASVLRARRQIVIPHTVKMLYREVFRCTPQWGPSIYRDALTQHGWRYVSRSVGYLREGVDYARR